ncbi:uncharacterized protein LAESUDRAFT_765449 [Laetiporus sulphureus 93-53]|uniref:Ribonuclease H1 N-terminal domain-containing protein n=1 Tax=Laetiporus sulphureus 93-53 TaxID=1314785 RepID=A0A165ARB7_9APHY|nr:uncharacterized protein LAESUDRAFT_765449 [Laetiporus sulphureus 93-53]KZS99511.1 hypothetical protein LAESUDRAFT_765449 [Laetiporus sulphureus 93-53]
MTNGDCKHKAHAEPEESYDGNNSMMISLDMLMAALHLISDQHSAEHNLHHEQATSSDEDIHSSSASHTHSMSTSMGGTSTMMMSTMQSSPDVVAADSMAGAALAQDAESAGFQCIEAEGETKHSDDGDDGGCCVHQLSTHWYCISWSRAVGVFAGWPNTSPLVTGVPGAIFQHYLSFTTALTAFLEAAANGQVGIILV